MNPAVAKFLPDGATVAALPSWTSPRLLAVGDTVADRWRHSSLYPGYRRAGRAMRILMRCLAASGLTSRASRVDGADALQALIDERMPGKRVASVLVGTPGPAQKITIELRDDDGRVAAYAKYGSRPAAAVRIASERNVLMSLPSGVGPEILAYERLGDGVLLVTSPVAGKAPGVALPPDPTIAAYARTLETGPVVSLETHPFIARIAQAVPSIQPSLEPLRRRIWRVVVQHGDFAPWNLRQSANGTLAFDWEYGSLEGFPGTDIAYYWLQTQALIHRQDPATSLARAATAVGEYLGVDCEAACIIARLSVLDAYLQARQDGHPDSFSIQAWRRELLPEVE